MRIDILLLERYGYTYPNYSAKRVAEVFEKKRIPYKKIFFSDGVLQDYMRYLREDPPSWMVSFAPLLPSDPPFCDLVHIPQFIWVRNSLSEAAHILNSTYGKIGLPTPSNLSNTVHLPHGVEVMARKQALFDVVFFSPLVDVDCLRQSWQEFHSDEDSIKATRAYQVISSFQDISIDVFGEHIGNNWYTRLPNSAHVHLHSQLPYTEHFEVLAQSKIVVLDPLDVSWELPAAAAGCLPLMADRDDLQEQIRMLLADSKKRSKALETYQEQIQKMTWENQTDQLIEHLYES